MQFPVLQKFGKPVKTWQRYRHCDFR